MKTELQLLEEQWKEIIETITKEDVMTNVINEQHNKLKLISNALDIKERMMSIQENERNKKSFVSERLNFTQRVKKVYEEPTDLWTIDFNRNEKEVELRLAPFGKITKIKFDKSNITLIEDILSIIIKHSKDRVKAIYVNSFVDKSMIDVIMINETIVNDNSYVIIPVSSNKVSWSDLEEMDRYYEGMIAEKKYYIGKYVGVNINFPIESLEE